MTRRQEILEKISDIPKLPAVVARIQHHLQDPQVDFGMLARDIELEPGMTANILQMANSAIFGWSREIHSIRQGVTLLGTHRIMQMVICQVAAPVVRRARVGYGMQPNELWRHSISAALTAERVADRSPLPCAPDAAFTAGLLHDIGKIVLGTFVDLDDEPVMDMVRREGCTFDDAERRIFGIDHSEISGLVLERWQLPVDLAQAARNHHQPARSETPHDLTDIVHVADMLSMSAGLGLGTDGMLYRLDPEAAKRVGLKISDGEQILSEVTEAVEAMEEMFATDRKERSDVVQNSSH